MVCFGAASTFQYLRGTSHNRSTPSPDQAVTKHTWPSESESTQSSRAEPASKSLEDEARYQGLTAPFNNTRPFQDWDPSTPHGQEGAAGTAWQSLKCCAMFVIHGLGCVTTTHECHL